MCTLSFLPTGQGYVVAMNRDERISRVAALPPAIFSISAGFAAYPHEPGGGTWIAANDSQITLALLNWNDVGNTRKMRKLQSRGSLIPRLIGESALSAVRSGLSVIPLAGMLPFRLVGISQRETLVREWRWDSFSLQQVEQPWSPRHWFSSSLSDAAAERERGKACRDAWRDIPSGTLHWLRRLHASHGTSPGPFSMCVHRDDAATVSYTEIICARTAVHMGYRAGHACAKPELDSQITLPGVSPRFQKIA
jgi:Transport and Golgi organisation 2